MLLDPFSDLNAQHVMGCAPFHITNILISLRSYLSSRTVPAPESTKAFSFNRNRVVSVKLDLYATGAI